MNTPVTPVTLTVNAAVDDLSEDDYRDIYHEIRGHDPETDRYAIALDAFVAQIHSAYTKATWSKYHRGLLELNRTMRCELRAAVGLAPLPATIVEAIAHVDPDAHVVQIGEHTPDRLILSSSQADPITIHLNGDIRVEQPAQKGCVTRVTQPRRRRIAIPHVQFDRLNAKRQALELTWPEFLAKLEEFVVEE